ncbi:arginyl-tRNA--protein transferase 1-like isoform X3 [Teleopsis dalmanni]|uniref:arginyl-tRNA--protein transferase 1-like isoform X3 n=1 Tax=Teleopsis dalmanni TaxID=139649 RepID=UPI0018CFE604|nr:arginyl-tRNA--protein transferase 1-like isoform X3 [Teleopsis dalmanni]
MDYSLINYYGYQKSRCGYCKGVKCSNSHGMHAYGLTPQEYQDLIDRGWRRAGLYCYKPDNIKTCCPCYTIKCDALEFKLTKTHKKILRRMNRFLRDGKKEQHEERIENSMDTERNCEESGIIDVPKTDINLADIVTKTRENCTTNLQNKQNAQIKNVSQDANIAIPKTSASSQLCENSEQNDSSQQSLERPVCKKAKQMRLERRRTKLALRGISEETATASKSKIQNKEKSLQDYINDTTASDKHKLKLILVEVNSNQFRNTLMKTFALYKKYQILIHNDPPLDVNSYLEFLQESPIEMIEPVNGAPTGYGSFHQQYWLDDKLIAVGVIDILPYCVSSVYFFYDPDYSFLSLGTYASLREIEFVQQLSTHVDAIKYYYMGFYIHSCPKMRYKGKLAPSYLLCPESYSWCLLTQEIRDKLDENKYQRLNSNLSDEDPNKFEIRDLDKVRLLVNQRHFVTYPQYIQSFKIKHIDNILDIIRSRIYKEITGENDDRDIIIEYCKLVGKKCAHRLTYFKNDI